MLLCPACGQFDVTNEGKCLLCGHRQTVPRTSPVQAPPATKRGKGRPRKHPVGFDRSGEWKRRRARAQGDENRTGVFLYLSMDELWKVGELAKAWKCSRSAAVTRLIAEGSRAYGEILFPEK